MRNSPRQPPAHPMAGVLLNELSAPPESPLDPCTRARLRARRAGRQQRPPGRTGQTPVLEPGSPV